MMKRYALLTALLLLPVLFLAAQRTPIAVLEYYDDAAGLTILDGNDFKVNYYIGMGLSPGDQIITGETAVEIRLDPNNSIVRIGRNTLFTLNTLQGRDGAAANSMSITRGKMRMVAARYTDKTPLYEIRTPTAIVDVQGIDFGISVVPDTPAPAKPVSEELFVFSGDFVFTNTETNETIHLSSGERADAAADAADAAASTPESKFLPLAMTQADAALRKEGLEFVKLDPALVPGVSPQSPPQPEITKAVPPPAPPQKEPERQAPPPGFLERFFTRMAEITTLEAGSITMNEETYARVAVEPHISAGKLDLALHFPIIYRNNLMDSGEWYRPEGNNEWSFGTDQNWSREPWTALGDLGSDLALKVKYLTYARRGDPFFIEIGNLSALTLGQGLLMSNYANAVDFPVVRQTGFSTGLDLEHWGLELLVNDLAAPEIYGGRMFFRPALPVVPAAVGITAVTDISPGTDVPRTARGGTPLDAPVLAVMEAAGQGDPLFLTIGMDLEIPLVKRERFGLTGFAEAGGLIPYLREATSLGTETVNAGLKTNALVDFSTGKLKNFGWTVGARGAAGLVDYRLELRSYTGIFRPNFYGPAYDRLRGIYAAETVNYLADTGADEYSGQTMAVAGELSADIGSALILSGGYVLPWTIEDGGAWSRSDDDEVTLGLTAQEGLIPFGITAGLQYRRTHFAPTIANRSDYQDAHIFDAYTTVDTFVRYPLSEIVDLEARLSTSVVRDSDGKIVYNRHGAPEIAPVLAIQARFGF